MDAKKRLPVPANAEAMDAPSVAYLRDIGICPADKSQACAFFLHYEVSEEPGAKGDRITRFVLSNGAVRREGLRYARFTGNPGRPDDPYLYRWYEFDGAVWNEVPVGRHQNRMDAWADQLTGTADLLVFRAAPMAPRSEPGTPPTDR